MSKKNYQKNASQPPNQLERPAKYDMLLVIDRPVHVMEIFLARVFGLSVESATSVIEIAQYGFEYKGSEEGQAFVRQGLTAECVESFEDKDMFVRRCLNSTDSSAFRFVTRFSV